MICSASSSKAVLCENWPKDCHHNDALRVAVPSLMEVYYSRNGPRLESLRVFPNQLASHQILLAVFSSQRPQAPQLHHLAPEPQQLGYQCRWQTCCKVAHNFFSNIEILGQFRESEKSSTVFSLKRKIWLPAWHSRKTLKPSFGMCSFYRHPNFWLVFPAVDTPDIDTNTIRVITILLFCVDHRILKVYTHQLCDRNSKRTQSYLIFGLLAGKPSVITEN